MTNVIPLCACFYVTCIKMVTGEKKSFRNVRIENRSELLLLDPKIWMMCL